MSASRSLDFIMIVFYANLFGVADQLCIKIIWDLAHKENSQRDDLFGVQRRERPKDLGGTDEKVSK